MPSFGKTIDSLLREGAIAGLWFGNSGHWRDLSGNGNHGTVSASMRQIQPGGPWVFPNTTDEVTVADAASLQLTAGAIVAYFEHGITNQVTNEAIFGKRDGAARNYILYLTAPTISMYDGVNIRTIATDVRGRKGIGCSFTNGGTPIGYADGVSLGNFSGTLNVVPTAGTAEIGNSANAANLRSPLSAVLLANRVLTATEHAAVYAELAAARWPSKQYSIGKRTQGSVIGEANLLAGYTLRPSGLSVPSHDGAYTGTLSGQAQYVKSILGDALALGRTTGAVDLGVGNAQIDPTTDSHWVEVWARPLDVAMSDTSVPIIGKGLPAEKWGAYTNFGLLHASAYYLYWYSGVDAYTRILGPVVRNKLTHLLYQVDRVTNNAYLYVDGVQYGPTAITTVLAAQATNWIVGKNGSTVAYFDEGFGGTVVCPRIGTGVLTPAQVQARYLEGARAVQFKTDWGYPISAANEGGVTGQQIGGFASPFRAGDATSRWRIETDTVDGRLCKVLVCKTAGVVYVPASYFHQATPTESSFGTWDWYAYKTDTGMIRVKFVAPTNDSNTDVGGGYYVQNSTTEVVTITEAGVGPVVAGGSASHSAWHRYRVTRSLTGLFEGFVDGVSFGTGTDTTTVTSGYIVFWLSAGCAIALGDTVGDHCIAKMLGVVAP